MVTTRVIDHDTPPKLNTVNNASNDHVIGSSLSQSQSYRATAGPKDPASSTKKFRTFPALQ